MAETPADAYGKLEMEYSSWGKSHVFRCWVINFGDTPGVGPFPGGSPVASLDALATALSGLMKGLFTSGSALAFGAWRGLFVTNPSTGSTIPVVEGTITPGTNTFDPGDDTPTAVTQTTYNFRDSGGRLSRFTMFGGAYYGYVPFLPSSVGGKYADFRDYILAGNCITSRAGAVITSLIDVTFDTNDALTKRYRR